MLMEEVTEIRLNGDDARIYALIGSFVHEESKVPIRELVSQEQWTVVVEEISDTVKGIARRAYRLGQERGERDEAYRRSK